MEPDRAYPALTDQTAGPPPDPAAALEQETRKTLWAVGLLVPVMLAAATLDPIGGAVIGQGQVGMASAARKVTHPNGGIIAELFVHNGDRVRAGDPLLRFDDTVTGSQSEIAALSVDQLLARRARLEAEELGLAAIRFPNELTRSPAPGPHAAIGREQRLFALGRAEQTAMRAQLATRIEQFRREIAGYRAQIGALNQQRTLIEPERKGVKALWDRGLVTVTRKNELERAAVSLTGSVGALQAQIAQTEARIAETRQQMVVQEQQRRSEAGTELASVTAALNEQQLRNLAAADSQNRSLVRAAYAGVVEKLAFSAVGNVVRPAEPIMEIVPTDDNRTVEAAVAPADIEQVRVGQPARVRLPTLNSTATPELTGRVFYVAAAPSQNERDGASYFPVRVRLDPLPADQGQAVPLRRGMPAEIFIETGERSLLSYLTKPLRDQFARAFRDN